MGINLSTAPTTRGARYAKGSMTAGAGHGMKRTAQTSRLTFVTFAPRKERRVVHLMQGVPTGFDKMLPPMVIMGGKIVEPA